MILPVVFLGPSACRGVLGSWGGARKAHGSAERWALDGGRRRFYWGTKCGTDPPFTLAPTVPPALPSGPLCCLWEQRSPLCLVAASLPGQKGGSRGLAVHLRGAPIWAGGLPCNPGCVGLWTFCPVLPPGDSRQPRLLLILSSHSLMSPRGNLGFPEVCSLCGQPAGLTQHFGKHSRRQLRFQRNVPFTLFAPSMRFWTLPQAVELCCGRWGGGGLPISCK